MRLIKWRSKLNNCFQLKRKVPKSGFESWTLATSANAIPVTIVRIDVNFDYLTVLCKNGWMDSLLQICNSVGLELSVGPWLLHTNDLPLSYPDDILPDTINSLVCIIRSANPQYFRWKRVANGNAIISWTLIIHTHIYIYANQPVRLGFMKQRSKLNKLSQQIERYSGRVSNLSYTDWFKYVFN